MAYTLVINPGSSSKKFALYKATVCVVDSYVERNQNNFLMSYSVDGIGKNYKQQNTSSYKDSLRDFLDICTENKKLTETEKIDQIAIRIVAPGTYFQQHREVTPEFIQKLTETKVRAPLHIPHTLEEIETVKSFLPNVRIVGISDSAFHSTIRPESRNYTLPKEDIDELDLYRFGYHGISVASVARRFKSVLGEEPKRVVVCHIGSGVSVTALKDGKSFDTTMGYAPGSGLVMGTRAGDVDAGALLVLMQQKNYTPDEAQLYLQKAGGLKAQAGDSDLRILLERRSRGDSEAITALNTFVYHIQKTIGSYIAVMGGVDAIVLTATASERSPALRDLILRPLQFFGFGFDTYQNSACASRDGILSTVTSEVIVAVMKTNEADEMVRLSLTL